MKTTRKYTTIVLIAISLNAFTQTDTNYKVKTKPQYGMDFMFLPTLYYNNITLGFNWRVNPKIEHNVSVVGSLLAENFHLAAKADYTANFYFKKLKSYWNIWARISNVKIGDTNYEDGGPYYNCWYNSIGLGLGRKNRISKRLAIRTELGVGASYVLRNGNHVKYPFDDLHSYSTRNFNNQTPSSLLPTVIPMVRLKTVFVLNFNSDNK